VIDFAIVLILSSGTAVLFGAAALHKLAAHHQFRAALVAYDILPARMVGTARYLLPLCELLIATGLLTTAARAMAIGFAACILFVYAVAIAVNLRRDRRYIDCGCAGFGKRRPIAPWMVVRNLSLALLLVCFDIAHWSARPLHWIDAVTVVGGVVIIAFLYLTAEELLGRAPQMLPAE
jgi:hypothetical protein